jgi:hypothetical protein
MAIDNLKTILGITDTSEDAILTVLKGYAEKRITSYVGDTTFPSELDWIADEVSVKRYNKLSAEGLLSEGISGITHKFEENMLAEFKDELDQYIARNSSTGGSAKLVMK